MQSRRRTKKEESEKQPQLPLELPGGAAGPVRKAALKPRAAISVRHTEAALPPAGRPAIASSRAKGNGAGNASATPASTAPVIHVFVDFENICEVDTTIFENQNVHFTLLVGASQTKLEVGLVEQLLRHAPSVQLVRLTSRGKNALDFTLAFYVGRAVAAMPLATYYIISRDKGFDPLVEHLSGNLVSIRRHENFRDICPGPVAKTAVTARAPTEKSLSGQERDAMFGKAVDYLMRHSTTRPRTLPRLLRWLAASFEGHLSAVSAEMILDELRKKRYVSVNGSGVVNYSFPTAGSFGRS